MSGKQVTAHFIWGSFRFFLILIATDHSQNKIDSTVNSVACAVDA